MMMIVCIAGESLLTFHEARSGVWPCLTGDSTYSDHCLHHVLVAEFVKRGLLVGRAIFLHRPRIQSLMVYSQRDWQLNQLDQTLRKLCYAHFRRAQPLPIAGALLMQQLWAVSIIGAIARAQLHSLPVAPACGKASLHGGVSLLQSTFHLAPPERSKLRHPLRVQIFDDPSTTKFLAPNEHSG